MLRQGLLDHLLQLSLVSQNLRRLLRHFRQFSDLRVEVPLELEAPLSGLLALGLKGQEGVLHLCRPPGRGLTFLLRFPDLLLQARHDPDRLLDPALELLHLGRQFISGRPEQILIPAGLVEPCESKFQLPIHALGIGPGLLEVHLQLLEFI